MLHLWDIEEIIFIQFKIRRNTVFNILTLCTFQTASMRGINVAESVSPKPTVENNPNDWLVTLIDALEKAEKDPEVKNFVLDISTNGGGSTDVVLFITSRILSAIFLLTWVKNNKNQYLCY